MSAEARPSALLYVRGWAVRWWHDPQLRGGDKVQLVLFFRGQGKVNFTMGKSWIEQLVKDLHQTDVDGDDYHTIHTDPGEPSFVFSRGRAAEFRRALVKLLENGPKNTPFAGYSSDDMQTAVASTVSLQTPQKTRWV